ncbi:MAG: iron complex transport system ATP-binding protein [Natronomonas sp.]|jgi:iron complex transport system ATP-binding protein|uniref:ABC transporter ATP-binding protein n=1 Tax=Natronomonas sp. TaxID=2184060 RepID=UPI0039899337
MSTTYETDGERTDSIETASMVVEELVVGYGDEPVIDGESLVVPDGEVTALVGPNGSGKSTLLKSMARQLDVDSGRVLVDGQALEQFPRKELARELGHLSQENTAPDSLTVEGLVEHGRYPHQGFLDALGAEDTHAIDRAIELAGVGHIRDRALGSLSGGQKQLAWLAMALAQDTDLLLLDEPTTFLDLHHQMEVLEIIERLRKQGDRTVVVVLHDIEQAARIADYVVALADGAVHARGPPAAVVTEELLREVFRVDATVRQSPEGPQVLARRPVHE